MSGLLYSEYPGTYPASLAPQTIIYQDQSSRYSESDYPDNDAPGLFTTESQAPEFRPALSDISPTQLNVWAGATSDTVAEASSTQVVAPGEYVFCDRSVPRYHNSDQGRVHSMHYAGPSNMEGSDVALSIEDMRLATLLQAAVAQKYDEPGVVSSSRMTTTARNAVAAEEDGGLTDIDETEALLWEAFEEVDAIDGASEVHEQKGKKRKRQVQRREGGRERKRKPRAVAKKAPEVIVILDSDEEDDNIARKRQRPIVAGDSDDDDEDGDDNEPAQRVVVPDHPLSADETSRATERLDFARQSAVPLDGRKMNKHSESLLQQERPVQYWRWLERSGRDISPDRATSFAAREDMERTGVWTEQRARQDSALRTQKEEDERAAHCWYGQVEGLQFLPHWDEKGNCCRFHHPTPDRPCCELHQAGQGEQRGRRKGRENRGVAVTS